MHHRIQQILGVMAIGFGSVVLGMIWSIANTAMATLQIHLDADVGKLQWMMNCFGIFICVPLLAMGNLGDAYGRKKLYMMALSLALIASCAAGFAHRIEVLIACMGVFGLCGSVILPLSQALLVHQFPEHESSKAIGIWSIFASISHAGGPLLGGFVLNTWGWRWIYWMNIPAICCILPLVYAFVKKDGEIKKPHCDWRGIGALAVMLTSLILGIMQGPIMGWTTWHVMLLFGIAAVSLCLFVFFEKKTTAPLFRSDLFAQRAFLFSAIPNACMIGCIWVVFFMIPLYLQNMVGLQPFQAGVFLTLITLPMAFLSMPVTRCYKKWGAKPLLILGFILFGVAFALQATGVISSSLVILGVVCFAIGIGWTLIWGPAISVALASLPHRLAGTGAGMFTTLQELGAVVFFTIAGVVFRTTHHTLIAPYYNSLISSLQGKLSMDQLEAWITNPVVMKSYLGNDMDSISILTASFSSAYSDVFWLLAGVAVVAILCTLFLPRSCQKVAELE